MLRSKDALRIVPYFVLPQSCPIFAYREAYAPLLCSYWGGSQGLAPTYEQTHVGASPFDPGIIGIIVFLPEKW